MTEAAELVVGRAYHRSYAMKRPREGCVYTLDAEGEVRTQYGDTFKPDVLYLQGDDTLIATWLTEARNSNLQLSRATGWYLRQRFMAVENRFNATYAIIWWESEKDFLSNVQSDTPDAGLASADFIGPLPDLGIVFLEWRRLWYSGKGFSAAELLAAMAKVAHDEVTQIEDARVFEEPRP